MKMRQVLPLQRAELGASVRLEKKTLFTSKTTPYDPKSIDYQKIFLQPMNLSNGVAHYY